MSNACVILWKSRTNGRAGKGTKLFRREEAESLAEELNRQFPQIIHEAASVETAGESENAASPAESGLPIGRHGSLRTGFVFLLPIAPCKLPVAWI
jgi:hypothetical protein